MRGRLAAVLGAALFGLLAGASQASTIAGVLPDRPAAGPFAPAFAVAGAASATHIPYLGGPVLHHNITHAIFWQPAGSGLAFDTGYTALVEQFLAGVAVDSHSTGSVYGISGEYTDSSGPAAYASRYGGGVLDTDPLPANGCSEPSTGPAWTVCLTDGQLEDEIRHVVATDGLPRGGGNVYLLITPNGFGSCEDQSSQSCALGGASNGYCGYHAATGNQIYYGVIPYNAVAGHCQSGNPRPNSSTADPALSTVAHEQIEVITDPLGDGWIDSSGDEIADVCIGAYGAALGGSGAGRWNETIDHHHYWLQEVLSRLTHRCEPRARPDSARIAGPRRGRVRARLAFTGGGRQPGGRIVRYAWAFGDGRSAAGRLVSHAYRRPGVYLVQLRVTDRAGNWAYAKLTVRLRG